MARIRAGVAACATAVAATAVADAAVADVSLTAAFVTDVGTDVFGSEREGKPRSSTCNHSPSPAVSALSTRVLSCVGKAAQAASPMVSSGALAVSIKSERLRLPPSLLAQLRSETSMLPSTSIPPPTPDSTSAANALAAAALALAAELVPSDTPIATIAPTLFRPPDRSIPSSALPAPAARWLTGELLVRRWRRSSGGVRGSGFIELRSALPTAAAAVLRRVRFTGGLTRTHAAESSDSLRRRGKLAVAATRDSSSTR
mmetsp:Transcript_24550/g.61139  ORF Transcript_24550/g.61139 Transcript_24550/m.61139 type:complete len:258 (-) Transcript_24550:2632-3405(-)